MWYIIKLDMKKNFSNKSKDDGHETHTTALVLMVLFTGLVLTIALGDNSSFGQEQPATSAEDASTTTAEIKSVSQGQLAAASDPFNTLPIDGDTTVKNEMITRGNQAIEQVISYETSRSSADLALTYQSWLQDNNYITEKQKIGNYAASFAATRGENVLIVMISYLDTRDMSRVEIINYRR
jgi:hypothetical protein